MLSNFSSNTDVAEHCLSDGTWQQFEENVITKPSGCMKWVGPMYKNPKSGVEQPHIKVYSDYNTYVGTTKLRRVLSHWVMNEPGSAQKIVGPNVYTCEHWQCVNPAHQVWTNSRVLSNWQLWGKERAIKSQKNFERKKVAA